MGKNKKGNKANIFKVAGAKSLKKTKAKSVNLGLKNIKQKVSDIDKEFVEINKNPKPKALKNSPATIPAPKSQKKNKAPVTKEEVAQTAEEIVKMDLQQPLMA